VLVFSQDGSDAEVSALIEGARSIAPVVRLSHTPPYWGLPSRVIRTDAPTASNVHFLLTLAFEHVGARAAIVLESDIELGADGFDYFRWAYEAVARDAGLAARVFTVNGFHARSHPDADPFTVAADKHGFRVWGWLCPAWSWPRLKAGWTWFHNWDITVEESIRKPSGLLSLSPAVSRTRNIGMQGINFDIRDPEEVARWEGLYIPRAPTDFRGRPLVLTTTEKMLAAQAEGRRARGMAVAVS
jgi:hypothetical protein